MDHSADAEGPTYSQLLLSIDLGDEVAEVDTALADSFVQTTDFEEFLAGRCDLITGIKGSGKSALLLMGKTSPPQGVIMLPAQPLRGPVIYETDMPTGLTGSDLEDYYLERWLLHTALTVAYALMSTGEDESIRHFLEKCQIPLGVGESEIGIWVSCGRLMRNVEINNIEMVSELIQLADGVLAGSNVRAWVLFDRLDDVTFLRPEDEQTVLRGLVRAHIYFSRASERIEPKLFLRSDILDRATLKDGVRNLDKVPTLRLNMNARDISLLIAKRFLRSPNFRALLPGLHLEDIDTIDDAGLKAVMARILPAKGNLKNRPNLQDMYGSYFMDTTDASGRYSARNVLAYMRMALVQQRRLCEDGALRVPPAEGPVLSQKALYAAWVQLSENRLHSYVYAEFPVVRSFVERLEYGPEQYRSLEAIKRRFFKDSATITETRTVVEMLKYCGVLGESGQRIRIGRVYRPALRTQRANTGEQKSRSVVTAPKSGR